MNEWMNVINWFECKEKKNIGMHFIGNMRFSALAIHHIDLCTQPHGTAQHNKYILSWNGE